MKTWSCANRSDGKRAGGYGMRSDPPSRTWFIEDTVSGHLTAHGDNSGRTTTSADVVETGLVSDEGRTRQGNID